MAHADGFCRTCGRRLPLGQTQCPPSVKCEAPTLFGLPVKFVDKLPGKGQGFDRFPGKDKKDG